MNIERMPVPLIDNVIAFIYVNSMVVLGAFVVAIAQEISALADNCHTEATALGNELSNSWFYYNVVDPKL